MARFQSLRPLTCLLHSTLLTMSLCSIYLNLLLACLGVWFPGFIHICPIIHLMSKPTHHLPLELLPLEFHRVRSWDLFYLFCLYPRSRASFSQAQNCQTRTRLFLFINMLMTFSYILVQTHSQWPPKSLPLESCIVRMNDWLLQNGLHLNPSKSEAIAFFNPRSKPLATLAESIKSISVAGSPIKLQSSIKSLVVHLDSKISFDKHVSEVCRAS